MRTHFGQPATDNGQRISHLTSDLRHSAFREIRGCSKSSRVWRAGPEAPPQGCCLRERGATDSLVSGRLPIAAFLPFIAAFLQSIVDFLQIIAPFIQIETWMHSSTRELKLHRNLFQMLFLAPQKLFLAPQTLQKLFVAPRKLFVVFLLTCIKVGR